MEQGSNTAAALAARTAGMTDEQILDLDLATFSAENNQVGAPEIFPEASGEPDLWRTMPSEPQRPPTGDPAPGTSLRAAGENSNPQHSSSAQGGAVESARSDPAWLKQLETQQPAAVAEARQWQEAAKDMAALDAAFFSGDPGARSGLAARLFESDPAAFREMLAASVRMLASRDPQALAEMARQFGMKEEQAASVPARSLAQAARAQQTTATPNQIAGENRSIGAFPAESYRAFESATNEDVARFTRDAIDRTLSSTLPEGVGDGARRRIGDDIFEELHATLSSDRELSRQVGEMLRGWNFDGATKQQVVSLISGRARAIMPEVARRVVTEWTSSVLSSDRARAARVDAAAARRDITGGRLPEPVPAGALRPRNIDYSRMSDEQILEL